MEDKDYRDMFNILSSNLNDIDKEHMLLDSDYKLWKDNILKLDGFKTYLLRENDKLIGYFQCIRKGNNCFLCEIQIDNNYKSDKKTFRRLMKEFINILEVKDNDMIYGNISIRNIRAREVFMSIGMINFEDNKYKIAGSKLLEWINK